MNSSVRILKRTIDIAGALAGLALTAPLFPLVAAAIKLTSRGPLFYRQRRAGELLSSHLGQLRFSEFDMFKFRTMRVDAERATGPVLATADDPRVTPVGRFLRRTRIDELPQFLNILRGEMSLGGPRPERPELLVNLAMAIPFFEERMRGLRPGITGLAQIHLTYSGRAPAHSEVANCAASLGNPYHIAGAEDSDADGMRLKMLYDMAYAAATESFVSYLSTELSVILKTPLVMIAGLGT